MPSKDKATNFPVPSREDRQVFSELCGQKPKLASSVVRKRLKEAGLLPHDKRVAGVYWNLEQLEHVDIWELTIILTQNDLVNKAMKPDGKPYQVSFLFKLSRRELSHPS